MEELKEDLKEEMETPSEPSQPEENQEVVEELVEESEVEKVTLSQEEYDHLIQQEEIAENYRKENEKYRGKKVRALFPEKVKPETIVDNPNELLETDIRAIELDAKGKERDIYDEEFAEKINELSETEFSAFQTEFKDRRPFTQIGVERGTFVSRKEIRQRLQTCLDHAVSSHKVDKEEDARLKGQAEVIEAQKAEVRTETTIRKDGGKGVTEADKEYSQMSGGAITPERAKQIRELKEARDKEFAPKSLI
jgi:hypothetical protein